MHILAVGIAIAGTVVYHVFQKSIPVNIHPALVLLATYLTAFLSSLLLFVFFPLKEGLQAELGRVTLAAFLPGLAILGIEAGFLLAYRAGWQINLAGLTVNMAVTLLLIPIGLLLFREGLSPVKLLGVAVCVIGLLLVQAG
ncbi:MAG: hypothetical protein IPK19_36800 [Chloroflexi bacterium]|nr:hypothetical protein [Chloroflexota bacterium]